MKNKSLLVCLLISLLFLPATIFAQVKEPRVVKIDGSSTVYPISEAVAEEFQKKYKDIKVTVGISGTGGGFKKFSRGEIDISNASRPITKKEMDACKENGVEYIELPIAYDGLAVVVNPKNRWVKSLTVADLKKMWEPAAEGKITKWNDVRTEWPDLPLKLYGAGVDSGTYDYFTEAVVGKAKSSRGDFTSSEDDNVLVLGVARDRNALGFFGLAYYEENRDILKLVSIINPKTQKPVFPSEKTVMDGSYQPLSRPIFIYVNKKSLEKPEVSEFVSFYLKNAPRLVKDVKYIPLPANAYKLVEERFSKGKAGTMFEGKAEVGVKIEEMLAKEEEKK